MVGMGRVVGFGGGYGIGYWRGVGMGIEDWNFFCGVCFVVL